MRRFLDWEGKRNCSRGGQRSEREFAVSVEQKKCKSDAPEMVDLLETANGVGPKTQLFLNSGEQPDLHSIKSDPDNRTRAVGT